MTTNAEAIALALVEAGVESAFGLPGGEVVSLIDACRRVGIRFFLTGHEASAAFMADVTGQITGRPGVCISTLGPGAMNLALGVANALLDRSPVLALTAQIPKSNEEHYSHQRLPLTTIFSGFCKFSAEIDGKGTADLTQRCISYASAPPCGPVHLALPSDLAAARVRQGGVTAQVPFPDDPETDGQQVLAEICAMVNEAKQPLVVVGVGCSRQDVPALRSFIDRTRIPHVVTPKAKGALPEGPLGFLGVIGGVALDRVVMDIVDQADLLLGVGFDPVECDKPWYVGRRIANVSRWRTEEGSYSPVECLGDIGLQLQALQEECAAKSWPVELLAQHRKNLRPPSLSSERGMNPVEVIRTVREVLPEDAIVTCDVGSHKYFVSQFWESYRPNSFFTSNGLSAMGYGVPAAIAAKLQFPSRTVAAFVGDGGLLMMLHNLVFLKQYDIPILVVCFVDGSLSLIRIGQQRRGIEPYGVDFPPPDFGRIGNGFGLAGVNVRSLDELRGTAEEAVKERYPVVIGVPIGTAEYEAYA